MANPFDTPVKKSSGNPFDNPVSRTAKVNNKDLKTIGGLVDYADSQGLGKQARAIAEPEPKLSALQRLSAGLGAFNPAEAILTGREEGLGGAALEYGKNIAQGLGSAVTGKDYQGERRYFKDVAKDIGIENKYAQFGLGFLGDVLLDPSTYFGAALAKGLVKGAGIAGGKALTTVGRVAPETETGLRLVGKGLSDAFGRAFKYGNKASKGATNDVASFLSKSQQAKMGLAASNLERLGTGILTKEQGEELALKLIAGKREEFLTRQLSEDVAAASDYFTPIKDKAANMIQTRQKNLSSLQNEIGRMENKAFSYLGKTTDTQAFVDDLIKLPGEKYDTLVRGLGRKISTREGWAKELLDEIADLRNHFFQADELQKGELAMADSIYASKGAVARNAAKSSDPLVQEAVEKQATRTQKFAKQLGIDNPYETYFPFIKKDKIENFIKTAGSSGLKVGSEGYLKQFRNLLTNEMIETNPAKAFFTSEAQQVTNRMTRDFLTGFVEKYGKGLSDFATNDEAVKAGYQLIKDKGFFGKELGYVNKYDGALIRDAISPEFQTINMLAKATGFDAVTSLFKRSVTGLFAPFHVRNYVSGNIQNFEVLGKDVFNPKNIAIGQKIAYNMGKGKAIPSGTINIGGKATKFKDVMKPFVDRFSGDTFYNADFETALKNGSELSQVAKMFSKERLKTTAKTLGLGQEAIPFKVGRAVGQFIEHQQKATAYVTALNQGKTVQEALELATKAGFDYRELTRFESQIMRRLVPFYSFTRKNIGLQLSTLKENPQRINQILKFFENNPLNLFGIGGEDLTAEEKKNLPDFLKESLGTNLKDTPEGLKQIISSYGTPIEAFTQLFGGNPILRAISQTNPLIKSFAESGHTPLVLLKDGEIKVSGIGKDSFRQRDLKDVYDANEYKLAPQFIKDMLEIKPVQKDILEKQSNGKLKKVGEKTQYVADPVKLLIARSLFTSRGVSYLDQVFGGDMEGFVKLMKTTTGIKPQQVDLQMQESIKETEKKRALEDYLAPRTDLNKFQTTYIQE